MKGSSVMGKIKNGTTGLRRIVRKSSREAEEGYPRFALETDQLVIFEGERKKRTRC